MSMKKVAVIMGSDSDLPVLKGAFDTLRQLEIPFEAHVYSAHRTPAAGGGLCLIGGGERLRRADRRGGQGGASGGRAGGATPCCR